MMVQGHSISDSKRQAQWQRQQRCYHNRVTDFYGHFIHYIDFVLAVHAKEAAETAIVLIHCCYALFMSTTAARVHTIIISKRCAKITLQYNGEGEGLHNALCRRWRKYLHTYTRARARADREVRRSVLVTRVGPVAGGTIR